MAADEQTVGGNTSITGGFPIGASTSESLQSQQVMGNDVPIDVNPNAIYARSQALTVDIAGKNYEAAAARREVIAQGLMAKSAGGA